LMLIGTEHHRHTCQECAEICRQCADDCERIGDMQSCVDACRKVSIRGGPQDLKSRA
ncbi:four-helix bundle copper-binding protein, partial [Neorhizobium huautlense]|uniref:four-helix bundle copper-binding protein n=1 Tax=Neorhizobium huautlense TaxID=67774 RepID=UPI00130049BB